MLFILTHFSKTHTWLLPVFAVGLGAPRWCQVCTTISYINSWIKFLHIRRCYGVLRLWPYTFPGLEPQVHTLESLFGYGSVFSMQFKVSDWEWFCSKYVLRIIHSYFATYSSAPVIDSVSPSCLCHPRIRTDHWFHLCYDRSCNRTKRCWSWLCFPGCCEMGLFRRPFWCVYPSWSILSKF